LSFLELHPELFHVIFSHLLTTVKLNAESSLHYLRKSPQNLGGDITPAIEAHHHLNWMAIGVPLRVRVQRFSKDCTILDIW
jgi:hypothetical protein